MQIYEVTNLLRRHCVKKPVFAALPVFSQKA